MKKLFFAFILNFIFPLCAIADQPNTPDYMKGYIYSKLEDRFANVQFDIRGCDIILYNCNSAEFEEIKNYLETICPDYTVQFSNESMAIEEYNDDSGQLIPELNPFFPTMLAQPHMLGYSAGYRSYDRVFKASLPVSIGDQFSLYQFKINSPAQLYFGIEACVWAIFEAKYQSLSLINADYFVSLPLTYINDRFSARVRFFHQSSHLGDEFLLDHPKIVRVNPSMEGIDLALAYEITDNLVGFLGYTRIVRSDKSFKMKPNCIYYGFNYFLDFVKIRLFNVDALPYVAAFFANNENNRWSLDSSVAIGYQWDKSYGRKLRIFLIGHDGYSAEGQFARKKSQYISINLQYGY